MASKRKSTIPCMIPIKTMAVEAADVNTAQPSSEERQQVPPPESVATRAVMNESLGDLTNGHRHLKEGRNCICKYCDFISQDLNKFLLHMESQHLEFNVDPNFVCVECSFLVKTFEGLALHNAENHAGETSFIWNVAKEDNQIVVEQSFPEAVNHDLSTDVSEDQQGSFTEISRTKTPIMKMLKSKPEQKRITVTQTQKDNSSSQPGSEKETPKVSNNTAKCAINGTTTVVPATSSLMTSSQPPNGSLISTLPILRTGVTQIVPMVQSLQQQPLLQQQTVLQQQPLLQQQPQLQHQSHRLPNSNSLPKVMIPLSSIPTYNAAMDSNSFLKNSFHKFPYPAKPELCWLTVVTKYPEEQIKIWFTAQRLKQGISWSPEEIEDARRKMFNTIIQTVPQPTITLLNAPLATNAKGVQHLIHSSLPCQVVGQSTTTGVLVAQPLMTNGIQVTSSPITIAVSTAPKQQVVTKPSTVQSEPASNVKVVSTVQSLLTASPSISSQINVVDPNSNKNKKSQEQLTALKDSFFQNQFPQQDEVERLMKITGLSTREVRKWFSDRRYHYRNLKGMKPMPSGEAITSTVIIDPIADDYLPPSPVAQQQPTRRQSWSHAPDFTPTKYKERAPEQLKALESSFEQNPFPPEEEVDRLRSETKMTRREIDSWFSERRKKKTAEDNLKKSHEMSELEEDDDAEECGEEEESVDEGKVPEKSGSVGTANSMLAPIEQKVLPIKINLKNLKVTDASGKPTVQMSSPGSDRSSRPSIIQRKKTSEQLHLLKQLFVRTQWPSNEEYDTLAVQTGLPRTEVVRWFGDNRYAYKNNQLKWVDDYSKGIFPGGLKPDKKSSQAVLKDYFKKHKTLREGDLESLCEKTQMSQEEVKSWFNVKMAEDADNLSDPSSEDQQSSNGDQAGSNRRAYDACSEVSESSENLETSTKEGSTDLSKTCTPTPEMPLEAE